MTDRDWPRSKDRKSERKKSDHAGVSSNCGWLPMSRLVSPPACVVIWFPSPHAFLHWLQVSTLQCPITTSQGITNYYSIWRGKSNCWRRWGTRWPVKSTDWRLRKEGSAMLWWGKRPDRLCRRHRWLMISHPPLDHCQHPYKSVKNKNQPHPSQQDWLFLVYQCTADQINLINWE